MSFTNFGLIKRSSATEVETLKEPTIEKSQTQQNNLLPLVNIGDKVVFAPQTQINKERNCSNSSFEI